MRTVKNSRLLTGSKSLCSRHLNPLLRLFAAYIVIAQTSGAIIPSTTTLLSRTRDSSKPSSASTTLGISDLAELWFVMALRSRISSNVTTGDAGQSSASASADGVRVNASDGETVEATTNDGKGTVVATAEHRKGKDVNIFLIAGIASGVVVGLVLVGLSCICCYRVRNARKFSDDALRASDGNGFVPPDYNAPNKSSDRRDSVPWGHPRVNVNVQVTR